MLELFISHNISEAKKTLRNTKDYCWTHGICNHPSKKCKHPLPGHKYEATITNRMGGCHYDALSPEKSSSVESHRRSSGGYQQPSHLHNYDGLSPEKSSSVEAHRRNSGGYQQPSNLHYYHDDGSASIKTYPISLSSDLASDGK
jgi:hypothetical protein